MRVSVLTYIFGSDLGPHQIAAIYNMLSVHTHTVSINMSPSIGIEPFNPFIIWFWICFWYVYITYNLLAYWKYCRQRSMFILFRDIFDTVLVNCKDIFEANIKLFYWWYRHQSELYSLRPLNWLPGNSYDIKIRKKFIRAEPLSWFT